MNGRVGFVGSQSLGVKCLHTALKLGYTVPLVITTVPDLHEVWGEDLGMIAKTLGIPVHKTKKMSDLHQKLIARANLDLLCVTGWRYLIPSKIYKLPNLGSIGFHFAPLPLGRGFAPVTSAIIYGFSQTAVSLFQLADEVDSGDLVGQTYTGIGADETGPELLARLTDLAVELFKNQLPLLMSGSAVVTKQSSELEPSYFPMRIPDDSRIDWSQTAREIYDLIRAMTLPFPAAFCRFRGEKLLITKAKLRTKYPNVYGIPGQVVFLREDGVDVLTGNGCITITEVTLDQNSHPQPATEMLNSLKIRLG